MGRSGRWLGVALVALSLAGAWQYRDRLKARLQPAVSALAPAAPAPRAPVPPDVVYSWVDRQGVTHFEQQKGNARGRRIELDGSRITPLAPVDPALADRMRQAAASDAAAASRDSAGSEAAGGAPAGAASPAGAATGSAGTEAGPPGQPAAGSLESLRQELQVQARKMQHTKAARQDF